MATIQDIAQMSGYSIGTVSRVINSRPGVSEEARTKVEAVIREQGYQPNSSARMLRQSVSSEISIIVRGINSTFLHSILEKVQSRLREHGETANVVFISEREDEVSAAAQVMRNLKPKGLIFLGGSSMAFREGFAEIGAPSVLISADGSGLGFDNLSSFTTDDRDAAAHVVAALAEKGHRQVGLLGGYPEDIRPGQPSGSPAGLRVMGAMEELARRGIAFDRATAYEECAFSAEEGYQGGQRLLERRPDLTAIFAISDAVALGALRAFYDMGLRVPEDISLVGFDGIINARYSLPRLATVEQDVDTLTERGVDDLLMRLSYQRAPVHEKVPYRFVSGESIASPRA